MTDNPKSIYNLESIDTIDDILPYSGLPHVTLTPLVATHSPTGGVYVRVTWGVGCLLLAPSISFYLMSHVGTVTLPTVAPLDRDYGANMEDRSICQ